MDTIEEIVTNRLSELNMTATDLAKEVGLSSHSSLYKIFKRNSAKYETLVKIANALGLPVGVFFKEPTIESEKKEASENLKYKELPFVPASARAGFMRSLNNDIPLKLETFDVLVIDKGEDLEGQIVFEVDGDSMEPNYYSKMKLRAKKVNFNDWVYISNGVFIVHYAHEYLVLKRIKGNDLLEKGYLKLISDNEETGGQVLVSKKDIHNIWKVVRIVDAPPR